MTLAGLSFLAQVHQTFDLAAEIAFEDAFDRLASADDRQHRQQLGSVASVIGETRCAPRLCHWRRRPVRKPSQSRFARARKVMSSVSFDGTSAGVQYPQCSNMRPAWIMSTGSEVHLSCSEVSQGGEQRLVGFRRLIERPAARLKAARWTAEQLELDAHGGCRPCVQGLTFAFRCGTGSTIGVFLLTSSAAPSRTCKCRPSFQTALEGPNQICPALPGRRWLSGMPSCRCLG